MSENQRRPTPINEGKRRIGLWTAGIFSAVGLAFFGLSIYVVAVIQNGHFDFSDAILMPTSALMCGLSLAGFFLIRANNYILGTRLVFVVNIIPPLAAALLLEGFGLISIIYIGIITPILILGVLVRNERRWSAVTAIFTGLVILGIEIWHPPFRVGSSIVPNFAITITILAALALIVFFIRQAWVGNFRLKLIVSFVVLTIVLAGALTFFNINATSQNLTENLGRELKNIAETRALRIGDLLKEANNTLTTLSLNEVFQQSVQTQNESFASDPDAIQTIIVERDLQWRAADAIDNNNDPLVQEHLINQVAIGLREFQHNFPNNAEVFITDRYGALVGTTNRTSDYYQADEEWWQAAYNNGKGAVYISDPEFDASVGEFSVLIAVPLLSQGNRAVIGVLRTTYRLSALNKILAEPVGETGEADMFIPGDTVMHIHESNFEPVETAFYNQLLSGVDQPYEEMIYEGVDSVVSQAYIGTLEGNTVIDKLGWLVSIHQSSDEVLGPIQNQIWGSLILVAVVGVLAILGAIGIAQVLVRPIVQLTRVAETVAGGNLNARSTVTTQDEVGTLSLTFNQMTEQLQSTLAGLEDRVVARTRDLQLAAEVGRHLSLVSDPETMLTEAVELIRDRFNLYYTQIYLADPSGRSLVLRAGSGEVGQVLLRQSHRLPIDLGSLNGTAAVERRAVIVENTETSLIHRPNTLLPETRSEMVVPLIAGDRVIGVLDMQSATSGSLSDENLPAFEALAGQLAITIINTELFVEAERARFSVEAQSRRLTKEGWDDFLNAIDISDRVAFSYDQGQVQPLADPLTGGLEGGSLVVPIEISGQSMGTFQLERDADWSEDDQLMVAAVARQVSQQIENMRLLGQAERYHFEAQNALRRLTREGWEAHQTQSGQIDSGFIYKNNQVVSLSESPNGFENETSFDISVQDESIGKLRIADGDRLTDGDVELVHAIQAQLAAHLENLRLSQQTERALATSQLSEERFRTIIENAPEAIVVIDIETGLFIEPNQNALRLYGLDENEILKVGPAEMSPPEQPNGRSSTEMVMEYIGAALQGQKPVFEWVHRNAADEDIDCEIRLVQMPGPTHTLVRASVLDIRDRKAAERAVQEAQERAQTILESVTLPMVITRLSDNILTFVNNPAVDVVQLSYEDVINKPAPNFYYNPEDRNQFIKELRERGNVTNMELQLMRGGSEPFWALMSARVFDYQGETSILTTFTDISDRIQAQEAVIKRAAELATVAEVGTTVSSLMDPNEMLQAVVDLTKDRFELYHAHIYMMDANGKNLQLAAGAGEIGRQMVAAGWQISLAAEQSLVAQAARERRGVVINDVQETPGFLPNPLLPDTRAEVAVPLIAGDQVLGVLDIQSKTAGAFTNEDVSIQSTLASQIAVALQNARIYASTQKQAENEALINIISQRIQNTTSVENALQVAIREIGRALGAKKTSVKLDVSKK